MNFRKSIWKIFFILLSIFIIYELSFAQMKSRETFFFSGTISSIAKDYKSFVANKRTVLISPNTRIFDQNGNILKIDDLKINLYVAIDAIYDPNGLLATKIVIVKDRGV
jgi:hypothetical protein